MADLAPHPDQTGTHEQSAHRPQGQEQILALVPYRDYTRQQVHDIFDPLSTFTPQAGTWGLHGIVGISDRPRDYVFFVTFGKRQAEHEFDEGISADGVLRWQSQPSQRFSDPAIQHFIEHDEDRNAIYLFLRTSSKIRGGVPPYTYMGRLKYLVHDHDREKPVYFTWQILDWKLPEEIQQRMNLTYEGQPQPIQGGASPAQRLRLVQVPSPSGQLSRTGVSTGNYTRRIVRDYAEQDAQNRRLGLAGEETVMETERLELIARGRPDLAALVFHVAKAEGDGAGYDIRSFTPDGKEKFIEVKTTRGDKNTDFFLSSNEVRFAAEHAEHFYLYRIFEFDELSKSGKVYVHHGSFDAGFAMAPTQFKASPAFTPE